MKSLVHFTFLNLGFREFPLSFCLPIISKSPSLGCIPGCEQSLGGSGRGGQEALGGVARGKRGCRQVQGGAGGVAGWLDTALGASLHLG